jgi:hypothetical protein
MKRFFFIIAVFIPFLPIMAQNNPDSYNDFGRKPDYATQRNGKITIPVVVHVVWKEEEENISAEQIQSQIDALNRDYQQKNDQSKIPNYFSPLSAKQRLASRVPKRATQTCGDKWERACRILRRVAAFITVS